MLQLIENETGILQGITNVSEDELTLIQWTPSDLVDCENCLVTSVQGISNQDYTLTIVHTNGCVAMASLRVLVQPEANVYIPNAFSPNGDGNNDFFTLFSNEQVGEIKEMIIVDRWGETVFRNNNFKPSLLEFGWNGTFKGKNMNPAVFIYSFKVLFTNGEEKFFSGDLTLVR